MSVKTSLKGWDDLSKFSDERINELSEKEIDEVCRKIVSYQFNFAKTLSTELSGGKENKELEEKLMEQIIKSFEKCL